MNRCPACTSRLNAVGQCTDDTCPRYGHVVGPGNPDSVEEPPPLPTPVADLVISAD